MAEHAEGPAEYLRLGVPPGWIELKAFADDETAVAWFDALLDQTPDPLDAEGRRRLHEVYRQVRREVAPYPVDSAGALLTLLEDDRATLWLYTVTQVAPPTGEANVLAVIERYLDSMEGRAPLGKDDLVESFTTDDGRDLVAIHTTTSLDRSHGGTLSENIPGADPDRLGAVYAAVRLPRAAGSRRDRLVIVTGVSPTVEERSRMSLVAAELTLSASVQAADEDAPPGRIALDATGMFGPAVARHGAGA